MLKKLLLIILSSLIFLNSMVLPLTARAAEPASAGTWYNQDFKSWYTKVADPTNPSEIFGERYTAAQVQWVIYGLLGFLINTATGPQNAAIVQCFLNNAVDINVCSDAIKKLVADLPKDGNVASTDPSQKQSLWSAVFADRPLSGVTYVKETIQNFSLVPVARAQIVGFGFDALAPVRDMWRVFRDISFGFFVIIAVVFSFMIMFRVKLSPQTVISVQSALPKIVTSLILVTFSYAIAGFLVDLMYVVIGLISLIAERLFSITIQGIGLDATTYFNFLTLGQPFSALGNAGAGLGILLLIGIFFIMFFLPLLILVLVVLGILTATGILAPVATILFWFFAILFVIAMLIALWMGIKTIWSLLKAFVNILLLTIFAPIQIAFGTIIPSLNFSQWLKSYVSNLAVFVVTGTLMLFSFLFIIDGIITGIKSIPNIAIDVAKTAIAYFLGPLFGTATSVVLNNTFPTGNAAWPPLLGGGTGPGVGLLFLGVAFVLFTLIPKANEIIQGLMSGKPFAYGTAIGEAVAPVAWGYGASGAKDYMGAISSIRQSKIWNNILNSGPGKQVTDILVGGGGTDVEGNQVDAASIRATMEKNKHR